jgi:pilus assembly protein CpaB
MNPRSLIFIGLAGVGVLLVVMLTRSYLSGLQQESRQAQVMSKPAETAQVLVATRPLAVGTIIKAEHVAWQPWPREGVNEAYFAKPEDRIKPLEGQVVRLPVAGGEPLSRTALVAQGERGFMAAILAPGMRAVTVKLSPTSSVGGFIFPGDRVDVILSQSFEVEETDEEFFASETVFQNVRVLGVDQRSSNDGGEVRIAKTATLEVTPKMAEKVAMLEQMGALSLSLRSLAPGHDGLTADPGSPPVSETLTYTGSPEVSRFRSGLTAKEKDGDSIVVKRGSDVSVINMGEREKGSGK